MLSNRLAPCTALAIAALSALVPGDAAAEDTWPSNRITLVVPFGAGTITDAATRVIADYLKTPIGQPIVVENRPGAGATLGSRSVARATPDGYTFLIGGNTTHSAAPSLFKTLPYDPVADFSPIARIGKLGSFLATNFQQPFNTVHELVAFAKANPGKLTYRHGNSGGQIVGETIKKRAGIEIVRLPYSSNPTAMTDMLSNNIQLMVPDALTGVPLVEAGKIIPLAVASKARNPRLPATPTLDETVAPGFEMLPWFGLFGPPGLRPPIVARMSEEIGKMLADPAFAKRLDSIGPEPYFMAAEPFAAFVKADIAVWTDHAKVAGIEPQ